MSFRALQCFRQIQTFARGQLTASINNSRPIIRTHSSLSQICKANGKRLTSLSAASKQIIPATVSQVRNSTGGDHVKLWQIERIASVALVALVPGCLLLDSKIIDAALALVVVAHTHWGLEAIVVDYLRPSVVGLVVSKAGHLSLYVLSAATLGGLLVLVFAGDGISKTLKNGWAIGRDYN